MSIIAHSDKITSATSFSLGRAGATIIDGTASSCMQDPSLANVWRSEFTASGSGTREIRPIFTMPSSSIQAFGLLGFRASFMPIMIIFSSANGASNYAVLNSGEVSADKQIHMIAIADSPVTVTTVAARILFPASVTGAHWIEIGRFWASPALDVDFEREYPIGYESHIKAHYPPNGGAPMFTGGDRPAARQVAFGVAEVDSDHALGINHSGFAAPSINSLHDFIQHHKTSGDHFICMPRTANSRDLQKTAIYGHMADDSATLRPSGGNNTWRAEFKIKETT